MRLSSTDSTTTCDYEGLAAKRQLYGKGGAERARPTIHGAKVSVSHKWGESVSSGTGQASSPASHL